LKNHNLWREEARRAGIGELYLCRVESFPTSAQTPPKSGFDAAVEFQPDWKRLTRDLRDERFSDFSVFRYEDVVEQMLKKEKPATTGSLRHPSWTALRERGRRLFSGILRRPSMKNGSVKPSKKSIPNGLMKK